ncbi:MAG: phosphomannomutase/phosphoglucomutase [Cyanobacteriota bacterium]
MNTITINQHIFRKNDIRGIYPDDLNSDVVYQIGLAFGTYIKNFQKTDITIAVGHDARVHSEEISEALIKGLSETGVKVLDIGICPTPVLYFACYLDQTNYQSLFNLPKVSGGIMITGSHNAPQYNGLKMLIDKHTLQEEDINALKDIILSEKFKKDDEKPPIKMELNSSYKDYLRSKFSSFDRLKVVVDSANGTAGLIVPDLLKKLGCEVIQLFTRPDGRFPFHHPDPTLQENMELLASIVQDNDADIGFGYDGDSDRIGIISPRGKIIWGDDLMIILSREIVKEEPGNEKLKFVGEVKCSQRMYDFISSLGAKPIMCKTGHSFIKQKLKEENALLACEMSGHVFFADKYFGYDDAIYATLRVLEIIDKYKHSRGRSFEIDDLLQDLPKVVTTPEIRVESRDEAKFQVIENIEKDIANYQGELEIKDIITIDGLRIVFKDGFALVRASNTEPVLVSRFEARSQIQLEKYKSFLTKLIEKYN